MVISGLHHGQVISDFQSPEMRNFIRCNPKIGDRLRKLSRKNANVRASQAYWSKHTFAASALMQNNGADAYDAVRCATAHLHVVDRNDVMSLMIIAIGEGSSNFMTPNRASGIFLGSIVAGRAYLGTQDLVWTIRWGMAAE
jgi:hypothetical protein